MNFLLNDIQEFKAKVKAKEEREIAIVRERVLREIQPKYVEIEQMKAEELNSLSNNYNANRNSATEQYNAQLVALQQNYENKKKEVIELAEKRKEELLNATLQTETYEVTKDCERLIADLDNLISKRTEKE
jgi:hypothetical protein